MRVVPVYSKVVITYETAHLLSNKTIPEPEECFDTGSCPIFGGGLDPGLVASIESETVLSSNLN